MDFTKMQGAGNDFVVVDGRNQERDWSQMAITVCNRHFGIGADSLIVLLPSDKADFGMRTFDTDGSEAETCGNGIRCLARFVLEKGYADYHDEKMTIETVAAVNRLSFERQDGRIVKFWVNMGKPRFEAGEIPIALPENSNNLRIVNSMLVYDIKAGGLPLSLNLVSMGNPHAVFFTHEPVSLFSMQDYGPLVENLPVFPHRMNFEIARILDGGTIEARVWERGVGETMACGSGACAIAVAAVVRETADKSVDIKLRGGTLNARVQENGEVILGGPAEVVFTGVWPD